MMNNAHRFVGGKVKNTAALSRIPALFCYGLLALWIPALLFSSIAGIIGALFSHLYIWVHFFCTERPDMETLYQPNDHLSLH